MSEKKQCHWCKKQVDPEKCFATQLTFGQGWYCDICYKPVILTAEEVERNLSQPSTPQE